MSTPRISQHNGVVEIKNKKVQEMERKMLKEANLPIVYRKEVVHSFVYILNRVLLRINISKTPYEIWCE